MSIRRNTFWNLFGTGTPFIVGLLTIPYLIKNIGVEQFGILSLIWTLIGYFSIFDLGLGRALTLQVASKKTHLSPDDINTVIKTGITLILITGLVGGIVLAGLSHLFSYKWLNVSTAFKESTYQSLIIAALGIPLTTLTAGIKGVLEAYEEFKEINILKLILGISNFCLPAFAVYYFGPSLFHMTLSLVISRIFILIAHFYTLNNLISNKWLKSRFNSTISKDFIWCGSWLTVSNIVGPLMLISDRFIISYMLGASVVAYYTVPMDMILRMLILPGALSSALFPRLAFMRINQIDSAHRVYKKSLKFITIIMTTLALIIFIFSYKGLVFWLGVKFADNSWYIAVTLSIGLVALGVAHVPMAFAHAAGEIKKTALLHIFEAIAYLPLLYLGLKIFGLIGAAIIWGLRCIVDLITLLIIVQKLDRQKLELKEM